MRIIYTYIFLFMFLFSSAQPNPGFEDWESEFGAESPVGWQTLNFLSLMGNPHSSFKVGGLEKFAGNYSLKIKSVNIIANPLPSVFDDTMGGVFTGEINISPAYYKYGFPYSGRPEYLEFWYRYLPIGDDFGAALVVLTKWNGIKRDTIAETDTVLYHNPTYQKFQLKLNYRSEEIADTAVILFGSSNDKDFARVGSTLFLDELSFTGWVGIDEQLKNEKADVRVFPNPAKNKIHILHKNKKEQATLQIINANGKIIHNQQLNVFDNEIDVQEYLPGVYFYQLMDDNKYGFATGKFTVVK
ncbi:MAG: T9SS type A sorting domain-containing protein [Bacteroidia bacterium]